MSGSKVMQRVYVASLFLWPMVTWAAGVTLSKTFNDIPKSAWGIVFILSLVSGLVSLLQRLKDEMMKPEDETNIRNAWRWFTLAHMVGALFAGMVSFLVAESFAIKDLLEAVFIAVLSYAGARILDRVADGLSDGIAARITGVVGGGGNKTS